MTVYSKFRCHIKYEDLGSTWGYIVDKNIAMSRISIHRAITDKDVYEITCTEEDFLILKLSVPGVHTV